MIALATAPGGVQPVRILYTHDENLAENSDHWFTRLISKLLPVRMCDQTEKLLVVDVYDERDFTKSTIKHTTLILKVISSSDLGIYFVLASTDINTAWRTVC